MGNKIAKDDSIETFTHNYFDDSSVELSYSKEDPSNVYKKRLPAASHIRFTYNAITNVDRFFKLHDQLFTTLTHLDLTGNDIVKVDGSIFRLTNLTLLNLQHNKISSIASGIGNLQKLTTINLRNNILTDLPLDFFSLSQLQYLNLARNALSSLSPEIKNLNQLLYLNLLGNMLETLPISINQLIRLEELRLASNSLNSAPLALYEEFAAMTNLRVLDFTSARIPKSGKSIKLPKSLVSLYMANTQLEEIPSSVFELENLELLDLSSNQLSNLSEEIQSLKKLRKLNVFMNKILNVPEFLTSMASLEVVAISNNPFTSSLPKYVIHSGCFLQYLKSKDLEIKEHFPDIVGAKNTEVSIPQEFRDIVLKNTPENVSSEQLLDRILGIIYGNALGDAVGLSTEFMSKEGALFHYNLPIDFNSFVDDRHRSKFTLGDWTDDTDQMITIMQSFIDNNGALQYQDFALKLLHWVDKGFPQLKDDSGAGCGGSTYKVITHEDYKVDSHKAAYNVWADDGKKNAPNGAVMRTSILGIPQFHDIETVVNNTKAIAKTTHADPRCLASCIAVTVTIATVLQGKYDLSNPEHILKIVDEAFTWASKELDSEEDKAELERYMKKPSLEFLQLDEGSKIGYTYKTLGAGFYAFLYGKEYSILELLTMEAGDADTNCAVAGALLGLKLGYGQLPDKMLRRMPHKRWLDYYVKRFLSYI